MIGEIKKMETVQIQIKGETALLMNSPKAMLDPQPVTRQKNIKRDNKKEAEKVAYRTSKGTLYVPATAIKGCMLNASSFKKAGKYALKPFIAGGVRIVGDELELRDSKNKVIKNYEIDLRTVVIQRNRVVKARPKIKDWVLNFEVKYNPKLIMEPEIIKQLLAEAGERIGILDFAPRKTGDFGCFKVTKFKVL